MSTSSDLVTWEARPVSVVWWDVGAPRLTPGRPVPPLVRVARSTWDRAPEERAGDYENHFPPVLSLVRWHSRCRADLNRTERAGPHRRLCDRVVTTAPRQVWRRYVAPRVQR